MSKKYFFTSTSPYRDACPKHPENETEFHYSDHWSQYAPDPCVKCKYEYRRSNLLKQRAKGRRLRKQEAEKQREDAKNMVAAIKRIYDSYV